MAISARNQLPGTVKSVVLGSVMAEVIVDVGGNDVAAAVTRHSAEKLALSAGDEVRVIIKATEVMIDKCRTAALREPSAADHDWSAAVGSSFVFGWPAGPAAGGLRRTTCPRLRSELHTLGPCGDAKGFLRMIAASPSVGFLRARAYGAECRQGTAGNRRVSQCGKERATFGPFRVRTGLLRAPRAASRVRRVPALPRLAVLGVSALPSPSFGAA